MAKTFDVSVSLYDDRTRVLNGITQGDTLTVSCSLVDREGNPFDLSTIDVIHLFVKHEDQTEYSTILYSDSGEEISDINPEEGLISITLPDTCTASEGLSYCTISLYRGEEEVTSGRFAYYVKKSTSTDEWRSESRYDSLDDLVGKISQLEALRNQMQRIIDGYESPTTTGSYSKTESDNKYATRETTIAGISLQSNISRQALASALGVVRSTDIIPVSRGGTGATNKSGAVSALGLDLKEDNIIGAYKNGNTKIGFNGKIRHTESTGMNHITAQLTFESGALVTGSWYTILHVSAERTPTEFNALACYVQGSNAGCWARVTPSGNVQIKTDRVVGEGEQIRITGTWYA